MQTPALAAELFTELKKYLVLCDLAEDTSFDMHSAMVDQAWHTFILFTTEYTDYGRRYFGKYLDHAPAIDNAEREQGTGSTFEDFRQRYEALFDQPLPDVWYDDHCVTEFRRVINNRPGRLSLAQRDRTLELTDDTGATILFVNDLALPALTFIARTGDFYVRELPGDLTAQERIGLVKALIRTRILRLAP